MAVVWESERKSESIGLSPCCRKEMRISVTNLAEDEFEFLSPSVELAYQLWDLTPLETKSKSDQKTGN